MLKFFERTLAAIDTRIDDVATSELPTLLGDLPLDVFGQLLLDIPDRFPRLQAHFPTMAPAQAQKRWTGAQGEALLAQSVAFVRSMIGCYGERRLTRDGAKVLDFGCGWGRLIRLMYKYVPHTNLYAVDPWDESIAICKRHSVRANFAISDWVPRTLPFDHRFDLIYAFSVFTHLSEKTAGIAMDTLRRHIADDGLLVITIRPPDYWKLRGDAVFQERMRRAHRQQGFAFSPHENAVAVDGEITYGDTSMSLRYIARNFPGWKRHRVDYNLVDPYQVIVCLRPV